MEISELTGIMAGGVPCYMGNRTPEKDAIALSIPKEGWEEVKGGEKAYAGRTVYANPDTPVRIVAHGRGQGRRAYVNLE